MPDRRHQRRHQASVFKRPVARVIFRRYHSCTYSVRRPVPYPGAATTNRVDNCGNGNDLLPGPHPDLISPTRFLVKMHSPPHLLLAPSRRRR